MEQPSNRKPLLLLPSHAAALHKVRKSPKKVIWVLLLILIVAGCAAWWFWLKPDSTTPENTATDSRVLLANVINRESTIPTGSGRLSGNKLTLQLKNLPTPSLGTKYEVVLTTQEGKPAPISAAAKYIGNVFEENTELVLAKEVDPKQYNEVQVRSYNPEAPTNGSVLLSAFYDTSEELTFKFPVDFSNLTGKLEIALPLSEGEESQLKANFATLPDVSGYGYKYEGWISKLVGPNVIKQTSLGIFNGRGGPLTFNARFTDPHENFNIFVISLEPVGDPNPDIADIKPFSASI